MKEQCLTPGSPVSQVGTECDIKHSDRESAESLMYDVSPENKVLVLCEENRRGTEEPIPDRVIQRIYGFWKRGNRTGLLSAVKMGRLNTQVYNAFLTANVGGCLDKYLSSVAEESVQSNTKLDRWKCREHGDKNMLILGAYYSDREGSTAEDRQKYLVKVFFARMPILHTCLWSGTGSFPGKPPVVGRA